MLQLRAFLFIVFMFFVYLYGKPANAFVPPSDYNDSTKIILDKIQKEPSGVSATYTVKNGDVSTKIVKFATKTKIGRIFTSLGKRAIPAFTVLDYLNEYAKNQNMIVSGSEVRKVVDVDESGQILALKNSDGQYVVGYSCSQLWLRALEINDFRNLENAIHVGCLPVTDNQKVPIDYYVPPARYEPIDWGDKDKGYKLNPDTLYVHLDLRPVSDYPDLAVGELNGESVYTRKAIDYDIGESLVENLTEEQLAPLFRYTNDYQSPYAVEALEDAAVAPDIEDTTSDDIDNSSPSVTVPDTGSDTGTDTGTDTGSGSGFSLPPFCSWAIPVCDFLDAFDSNPFEDFTPKPIPVGTMSNTGLDDVDRFEQRVSFNGQCPTSDFSVSILGQQISKPIPYSYFCDFLAQIAPWLLAMTYMGTAYFITENV